MTADWKDPPPPSVANFTPSRLCLEMASGTRDGGQPEMGASPKRSAFLPPVHGQLRARLCIKGVMLELRRKGEGRRKERENRPSSLVLGRLPFAPTYLPPARPTTFLFSPSLPLNIFWPLQKTMFYIICAFLSPSSHFAPAIHHPPSSCV